MILLHNVINNLLSNAIKFSSEGYSIFIKIHSNRNDFLITITDQGGGIDEDHLKTIFDPKLKISKKGTADEEGTGFGLPIAKKMISQIDGELSIDSMIFTEGDKTYGTRAEVKLRLGL
jgi:signal transduction histidine kinase